MTSGFLCFLLFWALPHDFVFTLVERCTYCIQLFVSSWWVQPRGDWALDSEIPKRRLQCCDSPGSNQTSCYVTFLYSIVLFAMSSFCSAHQRGWCRSVAKWVRYGLPWRWSCHIFLSIQQPWWGASCFLHHLGLMEFIMARGQWGVWFHVPIWPRPYSLYWQDVLHLGGKPSVDSLVEAH